MSEQQNEPEFTHDYLKAFVALMLFKLGGRQAIPLDKLENFPAKDDSVKVIWDTEKKAFVLFLKKQHRKRGIIVPKGIKSEQSE